MMFQMKKLLVALIVSLFVLSFSVCAEIVESGQCGENLTWTLDDKGTLTVSGEGAISDGAFDSFDSIKNVVINDGVTSIGDSAFSYCESLTSIEIPNGVISIGEFAFSYCESLTSIVIPDGVISIGNWAFDECPDLTIFSYNGSKAQAYAIENEIPFVDISTATPTSAKVIVNGKEVAFTAYNIGGNNYFKLRDIGEVFDFGIGWDGAAKTITIDTQKSYAE